MGPFTFFDCHVVSPFLASDLVLILEIFCRVSCDYELLAFLTGLFSWLSLFEIEGLYIWRFSPLLLLPDITIINLDEYGRLLAINVCTFYFPRHTKDIPNDFDMHDHAAGSPNRAMRILPVMHNNKA